MPTQHFKPESFLGSTSPGYLLKRAHSALVDKLEPVIEARGFTFTQYVALMYLREGLVISASMLCAQLRHDSGALTRIIDQLEARGLVQRERSRTDRRSVLLRLTEAGRATVEGMIPEVVAQLNAALGDFSTQELSELTRLLTKLIVLVEGTESAAERSSEAPVAREVADDEAQASPSAEHAGESV
jgi:DNA-binding MarR family transcriptional regulator